jgi:hypothetical protein
MRSCASEVRAGARPGMTMRSRRQAMRAPIGADRAGIVGGPGRGGKAQAEQESEEKLSHRRAPASIGYSVRAVMVPLGVVAVHQPRSAHHRFVMARRGALLLQPCIISRRRRHGRRHGGGWRGQPCARAESHQASHREARAKSFHLVPPGAGATRMHNAGLVNFSRNRCLFMAVARGANFRIGSVPASASAGRCRRPRPA